MKRNNNFVVILLLLSSAISCSKDVSMLERVPGDDTRQTIVMDCVIEGNASDTRTELLSEDSATVVWQASDKISLLSASGEKEVFHIKSGIGTSTAQFVGPDMGSGPYVSFYPSSDGVSISDENDLMIKLSGVQTYAKDSFGAGSVPLVASFPDFSFPASFRNICGLLCIKLTARPSFFVSKLVVKDFAGNTLWGDCRLRLDGSEGTDSQLLVVTNGSDEITLRMSAPVKLGPEPTKFYLALPHGSLSSGFSVSVYDGNGDHVASFNTLNPEACIERSKTTNMKSIDIRYESPDPGKRGYYKDLFMDSGIWLNSYTSHAAFPYIAWDYEYFATPSKESNTDQDVALQNLFFVSAEDDENGYLLYPDRQPRFRCIYVNGGKSSRHSESLGDEGRSTLWDFVRNGGSYVGSCAGAYLASKVNVSNGYLYLGLYPGSMRSTQMVSTYTDMIMSEDSALRNYYGFEDRLTHIRHNGGGYMDEEDMPEGTEILLRYDACPEKWRENDGRVSTVAYKHGVETGRVVITGSHPENASEGDGLNLFASMLRYAADGCGEPPVKASLVKGEIYDCTAHSSDGKPEHARIGDKQYHHFTVDIPKGVQDIKIKLASECDDDLYLSLRKNGPAWFSEADYALTYDGSNKILSIPSLEPGTWHVSVYAPNTVTAVPNTYAGTGGFYKYTGKTYRLNGIPYSLLVDWISNDAN